MYFFKFRKISTIVSPNILSAPFSLILGLPFLPVLVCLLVSYTSLRLFNFLKFFFFSLPKIQVSVDSSSSSLILSSVCSVLLSSDFSVQVLFFSTVEFPLSLLKFVLYIFLILCLVRQYFHTFL